MDLINTYFNKIYVINLTSSIHRKNYMIDQFKKFNITNYEIFPATNKNNIDIQKLKNNKLFAFPGNDFHCTLDCSCKGKGHNLSAGENALSLSHYRIYQDIVKNKYEKCIILEDDCIFTNEIENFNNIINYIPQNWELLYLGHSNLLKYHNHTNINNPYFFKTSGLPQTHIYALTYNCAKKLILNIFPLRAAIDGYLCYFMISKNVIKNAFVCSKQIGINGSLEQIFKKDL